MNHTIKELKRRARQNLTGYYKVPMAAMLMISLIPTLLEVPFSYVLDTESGTLYSIITAYVIEFLIAIIAKVLSVGYTLLHIKMARHEPYEYADIFYCFRNASDHYFFGVLLYMILSLICLSPVITGLYFLTYVYSDVLTANQWITLGCCCAVSLVLMAILKIVMGMFFCVLLDKEESTVKENLKEALALMRGQKFRLIRLYLSFVGMELMVLLSFTIGNLWVNPYLHQSLAQFYLDTIGEDPEAAAV